MIYGLDSTLLNIDSSSRVGGFFWIDFLNFLPASCVRRLGDRCPRPIIGKDFQYLFDFFSQETHLLPASGPLRQLAFLGILRRRATVNCEGHELNSTWSKHNGTDSGDIHIRGPTFPRPGISGQCFAQHSQEILIVAEYLRLKQFEYVPLYFSPAVVLPPQRHQLPLILNFVIFA